MLTHVSVLIVASLIDARFGEMKPLLRSVPHPVVAVGRFIRELDQRLYNPSCSPMTLRLRGTLLLAAVIGVSLVGAGLVKLLVGLNPVLIVVEIFCVALLLAGRSLYDHVMACAQKLTQNDLIGARAACQKIVGRNLDDADLHDLSRAAIESGAENLSDGWIGPALAFLLAGLPGLCLYKAVSTADSMIGYKHKRYRDLGWACARADDLLNLLPARITALVIALCAPLFKRNTITVLRQSLREAPHHPSQNAGWPEAATASTLDVRLGGPCRYQGEVHNRAWLNPDGTEPHGTDVMRALKLGLCAWGICLLSLAGGALYALVQTG